MSKKNDIRHLWKESFKDSEEYLDMYFDRIYRDGDALTVEVDGKLVSSILIQPYKLWFYENEMPVAYFAGAVTRRSARGRGYMSALIKDALIQASGRGDMLCAMIPAHDWLYFFFDRFGFSTVFLSDIQRFTSLHAFNGANNVEYHNVTDHYSDSIFDAFSKFEHQRPGGLLHSRRDFMNILDDLAMRPGGTFTVVGRADTPIAAMAWAVETDGTVQVNEVLGIDEDARTAALRSIRSKFPDKPVRYIAPSDNPSHRHLYSRGMARIVNAGMCLDAIARANPDWRSVIRITDPIIENNNRTYLIADGHCTERPYDSGLQTDFDIDIDTFNNIVFSAPNTGEIINFPSRRIHISLMPH